MRQLDTDDVACHGHRRNDLALRLRDTGAPIDVHGHDGDDSGFRLHHRRAVDVEEEVDRRNALGEGGGEIGFCGAAS
jgi:hypothetical protein